MSNRGGSCSQEPAVAWADAVAESGTVQAWSLFSDVICRSVELSSSEDPILESGQQYLVKEQEEILHSALTTCLFILLL